MDDSDKKPIIERVFTFIGSTVGFICGLIVAGALVENGNKDATIIVMGLVAPILFFRWAGQSIGEKIQSMMDGGKTKVINQLSEAAVPPTLKSFLNENEASCPSCDGFMREWNGEMRCWECGYTEAAAIPEPLNPLPFPEAEEIGEEISSKPADSLKNTGYTLTLNNSGPNYYRIKKIIAELRPDLSTFDIYDMLKHAPQTIAENLPEATAQSFQQKLEAAECHISRR
ncbi:MAG: hypothetical protein ACJZ8W_04045 [Limisphaerales bacterium]